VPKLTAVIGGHSSTSTTALSKVPKLRYVNGGHYVKVRKVFHHYDSKSVAQDLSEVNLSEVNPALFPSLCLLEKRSSSEHAVALGPRRIETGYAERRQRERKYRREDSDFDYARAGHF
jgi:hypothetical protein